LYLLRVGFNLCIQTCDFTSQVFFLFNGKHFNLRRIVMIYFFFKIKKQKKGQGLVEYALILVLVAIVVIAALMVLGPIVGDMFSDINASLLSI